ncbi:hypothetical protein [Brevibacillus sp. 179-C9.3 HS]|uniref:hypothetical protein n=1 Tax=unclassified Brevibacillus TaxID=2684853 RepID=UPI0039A1525D
MKLRLKMENVFDQLSANTMSDRSAELLEGAMKVIHLAFYSPATHLGEVDLSSFTYDHAERALNEILYYEPDDYGEDDGVNHDNAITLINRHAHFRNILRTTKPQNYKKKRLI